MWKGDFATMEVWSDDFSYDDKVAAMVTWMVPFRGRGCGQSVGCTGLGL